MADCSLGCTCRGDALAKTETRDYKMSPSARAENMQKMTF